MARKKKHPAHENHERWLVSYADFITLLFAFFVVMFATSQTDKSKRNAVSESVKKAFEEGQFSAVVTRILGGTPTDTGQGNAQMNGPGGANKIVEEKKKDRAVVELMPSLKVLTVELKREIEAGRITVSMEPRGLAISFRETALFPSGGDLVEPGALESIAKVAEAINKIPNPIRLEGHTDSMPIHTERFKSNWELSAARSIALLEMLSGRYRVPIERMSIGGYAETAPLASNDTEEGRARNRRCDIVILNEAGVVAEPGYLPKASKAPEPAGHK